MENETVLHEKGKECFLAVFCGDLNCTFNDIRGYFLSAKELKVCADKRSNLLIDL